MIKAVKKFKNILLFVLLHLIISIFSFWIVKKCYTEGNIFYESLLNSGIIIIELSTVTITILTTYEFLIKQIHFSRYSEKIVEKNVKLYYIYTFIFMVLCIVIYCVYNKQVDVSSAICFVLLISLLLFLLLFFFFINRNTLDKMMHNKTKSIRQNINKDKFELKTIDFIKLYKECIFKEEYEMSKKLIFYYSSIVEEMFKNKSKILSCEKMKPDVFEKKIEYLLLSYELFIVKEKNNFATEMNKIIFLELMNLYKQKKKFDRESSCNILKIIERILLIDNTFYEVEPLFRMYLINALEGEDTTSFDEFDNSLNIFTNFLDNGRISEPYLYVRYIFDFLDKVKFDKGDMLEKLLNFRNICFLKYRFGGLFNFTKELDFYCLKEKKYEKCVSSYKQLIKYTSFYSNEDNIKAILLLLEELINDKERKEYILDFYKMYFEVIGKAFQKVEFIPNMIIPNYNTEDFEIIYDDLCRIAYISIVNENDSYLHHIISSINKKTLECDGMLDEKIFDFYDEIFFMMSQSPNQNLLNLIISKYIELYDDLDKNRKLKDKFVSKAINVVFNNLDYFILRQNENSYIFERIFYDFLSPKKDYHFIKKERGNIISRLYKKAYSAIEYSDSKVIKFISNIMAWETKKRIDDGTNPSEIFKDGLDLLNTLISVSYSEEVVIFVGTFITTIWAYAKSSSTDIKVDKNKLRFNAYRDVTDKMVSYLIKSIALRKNVSKEWNDILDTANYEHTLVTIEKELLERENKLKSKIVVGNKVLRT